MSLNKKVITLENASKVYDGKYVINNISHEFAQGESIALCGHNGCGKSTMLKLLAGIVSLSSGKIVYQEKLRFAYVPEKFPGMEISMIDYLQGIARIERVDFSLVNELISEFYLESMIKTRLNKLSKGSLQKVGVIQAILAPRDVIFLGVMYSVVPHDICGSFLQSALFIYFICLFLSMYLNGGENDIYEETLFLHCLDIHSYYFSRELLLFTLDLCYTLVLTLVPTILFLMDNGRFTRQMELADIACGGVHIFMCGLGGMMTGDFFHPRIFRKRRDAIIGAIAISMLAVAKEGLIDCSSAFSILNFILPPITDGLKSVGSNSYFEPREMMLICMHLAVYCLLIMIVKIKMLEKKKFRY